MVEVTTNSGFSCTVDERSFADFRVVDACGVILGDGDETAKVLAARTILHIIFNDEQVKALCDHVEKDGFVDMGDVFTELFDVLGATKEESAEVKKS